MSTTTLNGGFRISNAEYEKMEERGRQIALSIFKKYPHKLIEGESVFGREFMRNRYPEAYAPKGNWVRKMFGAR